MENTIKKDLERIGIMQKNYAVYLGISRQCLGYRLSKKETTEERSKFLDFLEWWSKVMNKEVNDLKQ